MMRLKTPSVREFEKDHAKGSLVQELLKIVHTGLHDCVSDERGDQENSFIYEIHSGYDLHSLDTFQYGDVIDNGAFYRKHKQLEMFDETPQHVSSPQHSKVLDEYNACVMDTEQITYDDKILKLKIYGKCPLLASKTSEQENVILVDLKHARRGKVDPVAVSILSKETEPGQVSSWWYTWRNIWCISLLMSVLHQVVKQIQSKCRWLLLLLFSIPENNFTVTSNPWGCDLENLTKTMIIVRIPSVNLKYAGEYKFTAIDPVTTSNICSLIVTESTAYIAQSTADIAQNTADIAQNTADTAQSTTDTAQSTADIAQSYNHIVPIVLGAAGFLVTIVFIIAVHVYPKMFFRFRNATASTSEKCSKEEAQPLQEKKVVPVDVKHARRGKVDPVAVSILSKETEPGQVSSWWFTWRNIWCISLLMSFLHQVVKQIQSKCRWLLLWLLLLLFFLPVSARETSPVQVQENGTATLVLYYNLSITLSTIQAHLDLRPPNKTNFDPVVVVSIFAENNFTVTSNPRGYDLVNLTKTMIIVRIPSVSLKYAGEYKFTTIDPVTTSNICILIVTESTADIAQSNADIAQSYYHIVPIVLGAAVFLVAIIFSAVYVYRKMFGRFRKATASTSEKCKEEAQPFREINGHISLFSC